jgi:hypothetical protein
MPSATVTGSLAALGAAWNAYRSVRAGSLGIFEPAPYHGVMLTPKGKLPTVTVATTLLLAVSITETLPEKAFVT